jgi:hypothetical protein
VISPRNNAEFVADMEKALSLYKRPYDEKYPVICFDEMPRQLIGDSRPSEPMIPGHPEHIDYEYVRNGACNVLMAVEPLWGWRMADVTQTKTAKDWALFTEKIALAFPSAKKIILLEDNLNTHKAASWYEVFAPERAAWLMERFELVYTPKHGSWLNVAEIELNVVSGQCLKRHIGDIDTMRHEVAAWERERNNKQSVVDWQFTAEDARIKLKRLYLVIN